MARVSKDGEGKTLYIEMSIYPAGKTDPTKNLTISCSDEDTKFKVSLTDNGLAKFRELILGFYKEHVLDK
jgi:hypothetical protein